MFNVDCRLTVGGFQRFQCMIVGIMISRVVIRSFVKLVVVLVQNTVVMKFAVASFQDKPDEGWLKKEKSTRE